MPKARTPQTLTGLARVLSKHGERAIVVSGADSSTKPTSNRVLVNVGHIPRFGAVTSRKPKVTIGAGAHFGDVLRQVKGENGLLKQAVSMMANPLVRNRVTVFSALLADSHYFDLTTALVTLGAMVRLQSTKGSRTITIDDFVLASAEGFEGGEFPAAVEFTMLDPKWRVGFFRVNPGGGRPTVSASVRTRLRRNVALGPEIVVSSSTVIPVRVPQASKALNGRALSDANVKAAAGVAAAEMLEMAGLEEDPYESSLVEVAVSRAVRRVNESPPPA